MNTVLPTINPQKEKERIVRFLEKTFASQKIDTAIIGLSGGIDSVVSFSLLTQVLRPKNIIVAHLYFGQSHFSQIESVIEDASIPEKNVCHFSIKHPVDEVSKLLDVRDEDRVRRGNIAARMRMIALFDLAKKHNALVCGTENKSENLLSYFTRFGDQASDIEPIAHLYKTQVYQLAEYLGVPADIIDQDPSAGLWKGQTDEGEFGFSYEEADQVLYLHLEKKLPVIEIEQKGFSNAQKIIDWRKQHLFKHNTPYTL
jgi:NAD+ synthase